MGGTEAALGWLHLFPRCLRPPGLLQGAGRARWAGDIWVVLRSYAMGHGSSLNEPSSPARCHPAPAVPSARVGFWGVLGSRGEHMQGCAECVCMCVCADPGGACEGDLGRGGCLLGYTHVQRVGGGRSVGIEQCPARPRWVHQPCHCSAPGVPGWCRAPQKDSFTGCPPYTSSWPKWQWSFIGPFGSCCGEILGGAPSPSITHRLGIYEEPKATNCPWDMCGCRCQGRAQQNSRNSCLCLLPPGTHRTTAGWPKGCPFPLATLQCVHLPAWPTSQPDRGGYSYS